jgi:hypothetical protein
MDNQPVSSPAASAQETVTLPPSQKSHSRRPILFVIVGLGLVIAIIGIVYVALRSFSSGALSETAVLSNGKEVSLGHSTMYLESELGLKKEKNADVYLYPPDVNTRKPLEATIYVDKGKVVAIRIRIDKANTHKQTGLHVKSFITEVPIKTNNQASEINERLDGTITRGYVLEKETAKVYYLVNPCTPPANRIVVIALVRRGHEQQAMGQGAGCGVRS